jgi:hypothetical protein
VKEDEMGSAFSTIVEKKRRIGYLWESQKVRDRWKDQGVGGWTILKWNLDRMRWYELD